MRWVVIAVALAAGLFMMSVDRRTDDTGVEVALLLSGAAVLTLIAPRAAIAIALGLSLPIAILNGGVPALLFAAMGAAIGYGARRVVARRPD